MFSIEVLYTDQLSANRARADLLDTAEGGSAAEVTVMSAPRSYEQTLFLRSTQATTGAVLGTVSGVIHAVVVLFVLNAIGAVTITAALAGFVIGLAALYGLIVGGVCGAHSLVEDAARIRKGLEGGRSVLVARYRSPETAARAHSFLMNHHDAAIAAAT